MTKAEITVQNNGTYITPDNATDTTIAVIDESDNPTASWTTGQGIIEAQHNPNWNGDVVILVNGNECIIPMKTEIPVHYHSLVINTRHKGPSIRPEPKK